MIYYTNWKVFDILFEFHNLYLPKDLSDRWTDCVLLFRGALCLGRGTPFLNKFYSILRRYIMVRVFSVDVTL